ncbi:carbohydrate binding family 9 domain-containing protein [Acanthopleuribacter pedis]|uniref:Carbohydrate binding family 9 domain-containing protein n=1 Tax=Acanthopleuribacter pedis TaxID=442870 RepID=A0A8J7U1E7_9BACT|nr:carbohydrate binding family 9 domain-containing protein [Acanthopleuribacter pedis]MBO1318093.1 carbohydrate binding family 9 domain-containing protein [Acanthopleuribacter pedis]
MVGVLLWLMLGTGAADVAPSHGLADAFQIRRSGGAITIDGDLSDAGWRDVVPIEGWVETNPGDNIAPKVRSQGYLTYDDQHLYVGLYFYDPDPGAIRAPMGDRDNVPSYTDYGGIIVDADNDGRSAVMFLANPRGIQYDAVSNDASGEDSSPNFFWESEAEITEDGWVLELKIPFATLRYKQGDPQTWGIMLYRNRPRDFRYQMFTSRLSRERNCFICNVKPLHGLTKLPRGGNLVLAPFVSAIEQARSEGDLGGELVAEDPDYEPGLDVKWVPNQNMALDLTINPDFSQVESDTAQISANERFALFFPERRPFFLEGIDLFSTPIRAVYTRTMTAPKWGSRATGRLGKTAFTALVGQDRGGGVSIVPGANGSSLVDQDYDSDVAIIRARHDMGESFAGFLVTHRDTEIGGRNTLFGPDASWRPTDSDEVTAQYLFSVGETPEQLDLSDDFDGRSLSGHGLRLSWHHRTSTIDWYLAYNDFAREFRADNGFVPQVDYRKGFGEMGRTFRFTGRFIHRLRIFSFTDYSADRDGALLTQLFSAGCGMSGRYNSFMRYRFAREEVRAGGGTFTRDRFFFTADFRPGGFLSRVYLNGIVGDEVDFANERLGTGFTGEFNVTFRPGNATQLEFNSNYRDLDINDGAGDSQRLFQAWVARLRGTYFFNARTYFRLIGQRVETERDPLLYVDEVDERSGFFTGSALLAYKLNWQSVAFLGYGDDRELSELNHYERTGRQIFLKMSYAFQR